MLYIVLALSLTLVVRTQISRRQQHSIPLALSSNMDQDERHASGKDHLSVNCMVLRGFLEHAVSIG